MKQSQNDGLREIQKVLHEEFSTMKASSESLRNLHLENTTNTFRSIDSTYENYGAELSYSKRFLREIKQRISMQDLVFYICFYIFLSTCAWILLKRFGIHTILSYLLSSLYSVLELISPQQYL